MDRKRGVLFELATLAVAFAVLLGPWAVVAEGVEALSGRYYENDEHGFKFRTFGKWTAFPPEPGDKITIVHFRTDKADRGMGYSPHCFIARLTPEKCSSVKDYLSDVKRYMGVQVGETKFAPSKKLPSGAKQYNVALTGVNCAGCGIAVEFRRRDDSLAVIYTCEKRLLKKYKRPFIMSLMSFKFTEKKETEDEGSLDSEKSALERRYLSEKAKCPPGWNVIKIPYYIIYYNCEQKDLHAVVNRLRIIRPQYHKYFPPLNKEFVDNAAPIVRVCEKERDFQTYSGMPMGVGGYWAPSVEELVVFRKSTWLSMKKLFFDILHHEGFHQYIFYACGGVSPCITFNEGPAEFFAAFKQRGNTMVPTLENRMRKPVIKGAVNSGSFVPIKTILGYSQGQYYNNSSICYAEGWALTSFLQLGRSYLGGRYRKEWSEIMPRYFEVLQGEVKKAYEKSKGKKGDVDKDGARETIGFLESRKKRDKILKKAMEEAIKDIDLEELEEVWKYFVKKKL